MKYLAALVLTLSLAQAQVDDISLGDLDDLKLLEEELNGGPVEEIAEEVEDEELDEDADTEKPVAETATKQKPAKKSDDALMQDLMLVMQGEEQIKKEIKEQKKNVAEDKLSDQEQSEIMEKPDDPAGIDFSVVDELSEVRQKNIVNIVEQQQRKAGKKVRYSTSQIAALKLQLSDISKSPVRKVYIPKGTKLIKVTNDQVYYTNQGFYAKAHTLLDFTRQRYIINEKDELAYRVKYDHITDIKDITTMYREPHQFVRLKRKVKKNNLDKNLKYSLLFNSHFGLNWPEYTEKLLGDPSIFAPTLRLEMGVVSKFKFDYQIGFTGMYESLSGSLDDGGRYSARAFSFGPLIKSKPIWDAYRLVAQLRLSLSSNLSVSRSDSTVDYDLSENSLLLGLEKETSLGRGYGKFLFGYNVQRKWIKAAASGRNRASVNARTRFDDSFALYIGHRSDWIW